MHLVVYQKAVARFWAKRLHNAGKRAGFYGHAVKNDAITVKNKALQ